MPTTCSSQMNTDETGSSKTVVFGYIQVTQLTPLLLPLLYSLNDIIRYFVNHPSLLRSACSVFGTLSFTATIIEVTETNINSHLVYHGVRWPSNVLTELLYSNTSYVLTTWIYKTNEFVLNINVKCYLPKTRSCCQF